MPGALVGDSVGSVYERDTPAAIEREALSRLDDPLRDVVTRFRARFS